MDLSVRVLLGRLTGRRLTGRIGMAVCLGAVALTGCVGGPAQVPFDQQKPIDRTVVEYPVGVQLTSFARGLTAATAIAFDNEEGEHKGTLFVAESGIGGYRPRIYGFKPNGDFLEIYPRGRLAQLPFDIVRGQFEFEGPIGGMVFSGGKLFVTHCDRAGRGVVTAFNPYDGTHFTVAADLPAEGDFGMTGITVGQLDGRVYFGVGSATNSGVVGLDNWQEGWVKDHPKACDVPYVDLKLLGFRFDTHNPMAGLFGPDDTAVTAPFQPFNVSNMIRIRKAVNEKPTGAIYSVNPAGGDLRVEAHGIRYPRGLVSDQYRILFTNDGMEMRGTRPVKDDPDVLLKLVPGTWYGFPDYSADLYPISSPPTGRSFQPPAEMIIRTGYPELSALIDVVASGLGSPTNDRESLLKAVFPSLSGAAGLDIVPSDAPFKDFRGQAVICLFGDRAPWATSGVKLLNPVGYKVVHVDPDHGPVKDFVANTAGLPAHLIHNGEALERPIDVKFGPDGAAYILDFGPMRCENGKFKVPAKAGRIFRLGTPRTPPTQASEPTAKSVDYREVTP